MTVINGGRWLQNHRETELWEGPAGGGWLMKVPQWSVHRQVGDQQGGRIEVFYSGRGQVPAQRGWVEALDLGPVGAPASVTPEQPGFVHVPGGGGPWLQNHRVTELFNSRDGGDSAGKAPKFSTYAQLLKQDGPRILAYYFGNDTAPAGAYWLEAFDLGPVPQPAVLPPPEPRKEIQDGQRPPLDYDTAPAAFNAKPAHFQVIDEGNRFWHLDESEFQQNFFADCGPIAVAHAVNFTNWSRGKQDTINAHGGIVAAKAVNAYGPLPGTNDIMTLDASRLATAVTNLTGVDTVVGRDDLNFDEALKLARTRWIIVDNFSGVGHISLVVSFLDGSERLALVQHPVNAGGALDAGDRVITRPEWEHWNTLTIHPKQALWAAPAGQDA
jgi:hypothetical protein